MGRKTAGRKSMGSKLIFIHSLLIGTAFLAVTVCVLLGDLNLSTRSETRSMNAYLANALSSVDNKLKDMGRVSLISFSDGETQDILLHAGEYSYQERQRSEGYLQRLYTNLVVIRDDIKGVYLFDRDSLIFRHDASNASVKSGYDIARVIRWMEALEAGPQKKVAGCKLALRRQPDFVWLPPTKDPYEDYCLYMVREVKSFSPNEPIGHLLLVSPVAVLRGVLEEYLDSESSYLLLDGDGSILCCRDGALIGQNLRQAHPALPGRLTGESGVFTLGQDMYFYRESPYSGLTLLTYKPRQAIYRGAYRSALLLCACSLLFMLLAMGSTGRATRRVTAPLGELSAAMAGFRKGNTRTRLPVPRRACEEVGQLTEAFNAMVQTINDLIFSEYEKTIALRTAQLGQKETQLLYLRSQINPHFLYNTLDTIRMKAAINGDAEVSEMIMLLVDFFRYGVGDSRQVVPIGHELKLIKTYLQLMKYRHPKLRDTYRIDESLAQVPMPNFILQPLVENSLLHGLKSVSYDGGIAVTVERGAGPHDIKVTVQDNGTGFERQVLEHLESGCGPARGQGAEGHLGLANVRERLGMFYPAGCGMRFGNVPGGGAAVTLLLKDFVEPPGEAPKA